jgi:circadian clock protein KaiC
MAHSNQVREFLITPRGVQLLDVYLGEGIVLTGSARVSQQAKEEAERQLAREEVQRKKMAIENRRRATADQVEALHAALKTEEEEFARQAGNSHARLEQVEADRKAMAVSRRSN